MKEGAGPAGEVKRLFRYPVKSMGGEELEACRVEEAGLRGDRVRVLMSGGKQLTARRMPGLLAYTARFSEAINGSSEGLVTVEAYDPTGALYRWDDGELLAGLERASGEELEWQVYAPLDPLTGVDDSPLLLVTEESLTELAKLWREEPLLWKRFRPNVIIGMDQGTPFEELGWIGRRFRLGSAEIEIVKGCERCSMITIHPEELERDPSLLALIHENWDGVFGVYARVIRKGNVSKGDRFEAMEAEPGE